MVGGGGGGGGGVCVREGANSIRFNMSVLWWQHGVCGVRVCGATVFCKEHYRRFDVSQFTNVCCKVKLLKQCITIMYMGRIALDDDRSGGRVDGMEWCGEG